MTSLRALAITCAVLFALSSVFPLAASVLYIQPPRWLGIADVTTAAVLFVAAATVTMRARKSLGDRHRLAALRLTHVAIGIIPALLALYFVAGSRINWTVLVIGLAWRGWLLLYSLPSLCAALESERPATLEQHDSRSDL